MSAKVLLRGRCSSKASSASSAAWGRIRRTWSRCARRPTGCSAAAATAFRCSAPGATRCLPLLTVAAVLGGNVRVGLEDSLYLGRGQLARSCADQVREIRRILEELSLNVATPDEAREMLGLKGRQAAAH